MFSSSQSHDLVLEFEHASQMTKFVTKLEQLAEGATDEKPIHQPLEVNHFSINDCLTVIS